jgi:hypothetical protein
MILVMAWVQKQNPVIHCSSGVWHWYTLSDMENGLICLVLAGAFVATMRNEHTRSYELHLHELGLDPDPATARDVLMATGPQTTVPEPYRAFV